MTWRWISEGCWGKIDESCSTVASLSENWDTVPPRDRIRSPTESRGIKGIRLESQGYADRLDTYNGIDGIVLTLYNSKVIRSTPFNILCSLMRTISSFKLWTSELLGIWTVKTINSSAMRQCKHKSPLLSMVGYGEVLVISSLWQTFDEVPFTACLLPNPVTLHRMKLMFEREQWQSSKSSRHMSYVLPVALLGQSSSPV